MNSHPSSQPEIPDFQEHEVHLREYLAVILKRKKTIFTVLILTFVTVAIATYTATPTYTASSQVLIERNNSSRAINGGSAYYRWDPDFLTTQFELIRSTNVTHRVVKHLNLDTKYRSYFFTKRSDGLFSFLTSYVNEIKVFIKNLLSSDSNNTTGETKNTDSLFSNEQKTDADIIASMILGNLSIHPVTKTKTSIISYSNENPAMARLVTNAIIQAYMDQILEIKLASSNYSLKWMTSKANEERKKLERSEIALQQYMRDNDLVTVENKLAVYPQRLSEFSSQLSKAQAEQQEYESLNSQIKRLGTDYDNIETISVFSQNNVLQNLREKTFIAEQKIKDLSKKYGYKHPVMINAKAEHALLLKEKKFEVERIIKSTRNTYELAKSKEANLKQLLAKTKNEMLNINERFTQYSIMKRDVDMNRVLYDSLTSSIKTANVTEQSQDIKVWVIKKASLPGAPSKPQKKKNLMLGLVAGLLGGIGLAFFIEYLDNTVKDGKDVEQRFGLTVLGTVEEITTKQDQIETHLVSNPLSPLAENYRLIRSSLLLSSPDHPPRSILVTSMSPKEGKTSTTCNLARILAQNGKKVLIIDCDMRRPRTHSVFDTPNSYGLSNYLTGDKKQSPIKAIPDEPMSLISSGPIPPNPAELLQSQRMALLMQETMEIYDFVLLDSPPIQRVTDSLTLSKIVDGVLLISRSGKTTYDDLESGLKKLHAIHTPILGMVVNGIVRSKKDSGYYGYYECYNKD